MHTPSRRRALALDFGRVLTLDPDKTTFDALLTRAGLEPSAFLAAYGVRRQEYDRGDLDAQGYWMSVLGACRPGIAATEVGFYLPALIDADFLSWARPRSGLHRLIQSALAQGVPTAIVSNMPEGVGDRFVAAWPWLKQIEHRFFSADFGQVKPDEGFYRHVLDRTGWTASDVLFIDDLEANVTAAARMGFSTRLFTGSQEDLDHIAGWCGIDPSRD